MIEIQLPCCDGPAVIESGDDLVHCEACGLVLELAPDGREPVRTADMTALAAAA